MVALKSVGVEPKSLSPSPTMADCGTCQAPTTCNVDALSSTRAIAYGSPDAHERKSPVAIYTSPALSSMTGDPHCVPPWQPSGTMLKTCCTCPLVACN